MSLLTLEGCWKSYGERVLLAGVSFELGEGERVGLVGRNGSGKSTLLSILAGREEPERGRRSARRGLLLGNLEQEPALEAGRDARALVRAGLSGRAEVLARLAALHEELASAPPEALEPLLARQARLEEELERLGGHDVEHRVESVLEALGVTRRDAPVEELSGGERRRVALARLLLAGPELLLLDEPTNHLDAFVTDWLEDWFLETRVPLLLVTHDRYVLERVVDRIVELDRGELVSYQGGYADYLEARAERLALERRAESVRGNLLRRETAWMRRGPPARTTKAKARIRRYETLVEDAPAPLPDELELALPAGPRLGSRVLLLRGIAKRFGGRVVVPPLELELSAGERLGIVGPNGAGKSTLVRLILGELEPDQGVREVGESVRFMSIDQARLALDAAKTPAEEVAGKSDVVESGGRVVRVEAFLDRFGFSLAAQRTPIGRLSGGERSRVLFAKLACAGGNVLVLDEPTNDLDLGALRALEEALLAFPGAAVIVSHDRWFLDRVATRILHLDGRGGARLHHGDLSSLLALLAREKREEPRAREPKRAEAKPRAVRDARPARLTPWQERELSELEQAIAADEALLAELEARLGDPALYAGPRAALTELLARREELGREIAQRYARWEALESLRTP